MADTETAHVTPAPDTNGAQTPPPPPTTPAAPTTAADSPIALAKWTRLLIATATLLLLLLLVSVLVRLGMVIHHTILLFALGGLVAYALDPVVEWLRHPFKGKNKDADGGKGLSRKASVALVFVALLLALGVGFWRLGGEAARQVRTFQEDAPQYRQRALGLAAEADAQIAARHIHFSVTDTIQNPPPSLKASAETVGKDAVPLLRHIATDFAEGIIVLLIALYFLLFGADMKEKFNALLPARLRGYVEPWQTDTNRILGGFVRGQVVIAVIMGAAAAAGCLALGIHLWLIIGLVVVVASLIPVFGPYLGAVPAIAAALIGPTHIHSPIGSALAVLALFVVINEAGSKILYPKLVGQALGLHEVFVLFVLFAGLEVDGIVGTLFAAPVAALAIVTTVHLYRYWQELPDDLLSGVARRDGKAARREVLP